MYFLVAGSAGWLFFLSRLLAVSWISELCLAGWRAGVTVRGQSLIQTGREQRDHN